jgi:hypothetical protein
MHSHTESPNGAPESAFEHWCEVCGRSEVLTPHDAFDAGWDFPPRMGAWGVISPRTCPNCPTEKTLWWAIVIDHLDFNDASEHQKRVAARILAEDRANGRT